MARQNTPAKSFLGRFQRSGNVVPPIGFEQVGSGAGEDGGTNGRDKGDADAGTINLASQSQKRPKRPRGRPRNNANANADADANAEAEKVSVEPPPEIDPTVVGQIRDGLFFIHNQLAMGMQCPEMALTHEESAILAKQSANVGRYYIKIEGGNKFTAWFALIATILILYIPRYMILARRRAGIMPPANNPPEGARGPDFIMPEGFMPP